jgi:hypothetical protein
LTSLAQYNLEFPYGLAQAVQRRVAIGPLLRDQIVDDQAVIVWIVAEEREKYFHMTTHALARRTFLAMRRREARPELLHDFNGSRS